MPGAESTQDQMLMVLNHGDQNIKLVREEFTELTIFRMHGHREMLGTPY